MTRRSLFKALAGVIPIGALVRVERPVASNDLLVIEVPEYLDLEERARLIETFRFEWEKANTTIRPRVVILDGGAKLTVRRGVGRIVTPSMNGEVCRGIG